ncbi:glycosyltransferase family 61 protein [Tritonibacter aquimaris]|uniref:glycosyltransferase family 61 protein n=1 Tax=Tritonibacter aquimaris TaxID=2663379 RepID=UPI002E26312D
MGAFSSGQPQPAGGWSEEIVTLAQAHVVPPNTSGLIQAAGVLYSDGSYCHHAALWRRYRPITVKPELPSRSKTLKGRWLWGGVLWAHFGHFLVESTARLWALAHLGKPIDGILFIPKRPAADGELRGFQRDFLAHYAAGTDVKVTRTPLQVEELIVPGQGFGIGPIVSGTPKFRAALQSNFAQAVQPNGPQRIYLSRSKLGLGKGGMIGEAILERRLKKQGYEIFHPQEHSLVEQIARYKAARQIIAADGSAVHLFAMVGRADQKLAMIQRRESGASAQLVQNVRAFCQNDPLVINALRSEWLPVAQQRSSRLSFGELDLERIGTALAQHGFIEADTRWSSFNGQRRKQMLLNKGIRAGENFVEARRFKQQRLEDARRKRIAEQD